MDRRGIPRTAVRLWCHEHLDDRRLQAVVVDLSEEGVALRRIGGTAEARNVGLELPLPGCGEVIWAHARTQFQEDERGVHRAGLHFVAMAGRHRRLLHDFLMDCRLRALTEQRISWWGRLAAALRR
jgi:hypothetical protein